MLGNVTSFMRFARLLFIDVIFQPRKAVCETSNLSLNRCLKFGWMFFFIATLLTATYQVFFANQVLHQMTNRPEDFLEVASLFGSSFGGSVEELRKRIEIVRLSSYISLLISPLTAWFFLYLLSGALFVLAKFLSVAKTTQDTYEQVIKIVSIGQAPLIFSFVPLVGPAIGNFWSMWLIARGVGTLFKINVFATLSIVVFSFFFLFSTWNSTLSLIATAYHHDIVAVPEPQVSGNQALDLTSERI